MYVKIWGTFIFSFGYPRLEAFLCNCDILHAQWSLAYVHINIQLLQIIRKSKSDKKIYVCDTIYAQYQLCAETI